MDIDQFIEIRRRIPIKQISLGYITVILYSVEELNEAQIGYSVNPLGEDLTGDKDGDWKSSWLVIGYEDSLGDPFFIDLSIEELPIFTAVHGEGRWNRTLIASSFSGFSEALTIVMDISKGRSNPVVFARNPLSELERCSILNRIMKLTGGSRSFWESWLDI
jgi:hypothetical protein